MSVLITGAAGFIGSRLAEEVIAAGESVVGIDRMSSFYDPEIKRRNLAQVRESGSFKLIEADLNQVDLNPLMEEVKVVYHLAAQPGVRVSWGRDFETYVRDNVLATQRLLEAARAVGVDRVVAASSSSVYGDAESYPVTELSYRRPISPYGVTKLASEELCRLYATQFGVETVGLRYFTIYGPRQRPDMAFSRFIEAARSGRPIEVYGDGLQVRDYTFVDDAVAATIASATTGRPGETYNVAGGSEASVLDVVGLLGPLLGQEIEVDHQPPAAGDVRRTGADVTHARDDLGYEPQVRLEEGLRRQVEASG